VLRDGIDLACLRLLLSSLCASLTVDASDMLVSYVRATVWMMRHETLPGTVFYCDSTRRTCARYAGPDLASSRGEVDYQSATTPGVAGSQLDCPH